MIFNQQGMSGGGGGSVQTCHVTLESMADHVYYTDANMTVQDDPMADDDMVIGTLVAFYYSMYGPEVSPPQLTYVNSSGGSKNVLRVYKVTG